MNVYFDVETRQFAAAGDFMKSTGKFLANNREIAGGVMGAGIGLLAGRASARRAARNMGIEKGSDEYKRLMRNRSLAGAGIGAVGGAGAAYGSRFAEKGIRNRIDKYGQEKYAAGLSQGERKGRSAGAEIARRAKEAGRMQGEADMRKRANAALSHQSSAAADRLSREARAAYKQGEADMRKRANAALSHQSSAAADRLSREARAAYKQGNDDRVATSKAYREHGILKTKREAHANGNYITTQEAARLWGANPDSKKFSKLYSRYFW